MLCSFVYIPKYLSYHWIFLFVMADESGGACDTSKQAITNSRKKTILMPWYVRDVILLNSLNKIGF